MEHISNHLQTALQNQELQQTESKPLKNGDEGRFIQTFESKKISDCTADEIKEQLRFVMLKVGLRSHNLPNDLEKLILIEHVKENFAGHNLSEIKLAFDLAIAQKLIAPDNEILDATCYENFSCLYFSRVMNAYRNWAADAYRRNEHNIEKPPMQKQLEYVINPKQEIEELIQLYVSDCKKGMLRWEYIMPSVYDKLIEHKIIDDSQLHTLEEKKKLLCDYIINLSRQ